MSKVDWSLAPDDATHARDYQRGVDFYKRESSLWLYWDRNKWDVAVGTSERDCVARPKPKQWSGPEDGLPPVNERVEVLWSSITGEYVDALILAHDEDRAVFRFVTGDRKGEYQADKLHFSGKFPNFRAIKTHKQIADEKREAAIREFMDVVGIDCRVTAIKAVDAGFKRPSKSESRDDAVDAMELIVPHIGSVAAGKLYDAGFKREVV